MASRASSPSRSIISLIIRVNKYENKHIKAPDTSCCMQLKLIRLQNIQENSSWADSEGNKIWPFNAPSCTGCRLKLKSLHFTVCLADLWVSKRPNWICWLQSVLSHDTSKAIKEACTPRLLLEELAFCSIQCSGSGTLTHTVDPCCKENILSFLQQYANLWKHLEKLRSGIFPFHCMYKKNPTIVRPDSFFHTCIMNDKTLLAKKPCPH